MEVLHRLKKTIHFYRPLSYYILGIIFILPLYTTIKTYAIAGNSSFVTSYASILSHGSNLLGYFFGVSQEIKYAINSGIIHIDTQLMALWQTILFVFGLSVLQIKLSKKLVYLGLGLFVIVLFNILRISFLSLNAVSWNCCSNVMLNNIFVLLLNGVFIIGLIRWYKNHFALKKLLLERIKIPAELLKKRVNRIFLALFILILVNFITNTQIIPFISYLAYGILKSSEIFLHSFGYVAHVNGLRVIEGPNAGIFFSDSCLGLELIMTFALFIAILDGKAVHKIWYISLGVLIIYFLNIVRITLIYIHLVHNQGNYRLAISYHDIYSYSVYVVVFIMWVIWINKFNKKDAPISANQ